MLYEFHRNENAKKPQSVHATYVISGFQKPAVSETPVTNGHAKDEDEVMQSSPYLPSSMPNQDAPPESPRVMSIIIAREEDLEGTLGIIITPDGLRNSCADTWDYTQTQNQPSTPSRKSTCTAFNLLSFKISIH
jgi:hypothetical protein